MSRALSDEESSVLKSVLSREPHKFFLKEIASTDPISTIILAKDYQDQPPIAALTRTLGYKLDSFNSHVENTIALSASLQVMQHMESIGNNNVNLLKDIATHKASLAQKAIDDQRHNNTRIDAASTRWVATASVAATIVLGYLNYQRTNNAIAAKDVEIVELQKTTSSLKMAFNEANTAMLTKEAQAAEDKRTAAELKNKVKQKANK